MSKPRRNKPQPPIDDVVFGIKPRKAVPFSFVLDAIAPLSPWTRPMFGCLAIYVQDKIVVILRDKQSTPLDNGVWLATTEEHHPSLRLEFPNMRSIQLLSKNGLGKKVTGWQVLPVDAQDFEQSALHACDLVLARDPRIGKVPGAKRIPKVAAAKARSSNLTQPARNRANARAEKSNRSSRRKK
ncbi:MAG TPA: hypothetical protein VN901_03120 [Candidatus Acidoferrales bacterium]|nr:hypothetical protein [Candidatus Acidoferrales bacterium]